MPGFSKGPCGLGRCVLGLSTLHFGRHLVPCTSSDGGFLSAIIWFPDCGDSLGQNPPWARSFPLPSIRCAKRSLYAPPLVPRNQAVSYHGLALPFFIFLVPARVQRKPDWSNKKSTPSELSACLDDNALHFWTSTTDLPSSRVRHSSQHSKRIKDCDLL